MNAIPHSLQEFISLLAVSSPVGLDGERDNGRRSGFLCCLVPLVMCRSVVNLPLNVSMHSKECIDCRSQSDEDQDKLADVGDADSGEE